MAPCLQAPALPFPVFLISFAINGVGVAMKVRPVSRTIMMGSHHHINSFSKDAQASGFVASIKENSETKMGILHAAYGTSPADAV